MKISGLITKLENIKDADGDLQVLVYCDDMCNYYPIVGIKQVKDDEEAVVKIDC